VSIGPNTIDRRGERPCLPQFYAVAKLLAEGRQHTLHDKVRMAIARLRKKLGV